MAECFKRKAEEVKRCEREDCKVMATGDVMQYLNSDVV